MICVKCKVSSCWSQVCRADERVKQVYSWGLSSNTINVCNMEKSSSVKVLLDKQVCLHNFMRTSVTITLHHVALISWCAVDVNITWSPERRNSVNRSGFKQKWSDAPPDANSSLVRFSLVPSCLTLSICDGKWSGTVAQFIKSKSGSGFPNLQLHPLL